MKFYVLSTQGAYQSTNLVKFHLSSRKSEIFHHPNHIEFQPKSTEELSPMTLKSDTKFKEKLTWSLKYDMRNLVNFHQTTQKSENFFSMGSFCPKYTRFELQKYRGVIFHDTEK